MVYMPTTVVVICLLAMFSKSLTSRIKGVLGIVRLLQKREFEYVERIQIEQVDYRDEIDLLEREVIHLGKDLKGYIDRLSKEVMNYTGKAYIDSLTGLFNRRAFDEYGMELIESFSRIGKPMAILIIDVDNFKRINDTLGHMTGDVVLRSIANSIKRTIRDSDVAFRYGGEEFVVLLPGAGEPGAMKVAEKVRRAVETTPVDTKMGMLNVTVSIGVTLIKEGDIDPNIVLDRSDSALYRAKREGKNRVVLVT